MGGLVGQDPIYDCLKGHQYLSLIKYSNWSYLFKLRYQSLLFPNLLFNNVEKLYFWKDRIPVSLMHLLSVLQIFLKVIHYCS